MPLRFTIRDLLWLTLVVALVLGWWVDRNRMARDAATNVGKLSAAEIQMRTMRNDLNSLTMQLQQLKTQSRLPTLDNMPIYPSASPDSPTRTYSIRPKMDTR
jgi:hypothetical protein